MQTEINISSTSTIDDVSGPPSPKRARTDLRQPEEQSTSSNLPIDLQNLNLTNPGLFRYLFRNLDFAKEFINSVLQLQDLSIQENFQLRTSPASNFIEFEDKNTVYFLPIPTNITPVKKSFLKKIDTIINDCIIDLSDKSKILLDTSQSVTRHGSSYAASCSKYGFVKKFFGIVITKLKLNDDIEYLEKFKENDYVTWSPYYQQDPSRSYFDDGDLNSGIFYITPPSCHFKATTKLDAFISLFHLNKITPQLLLFVNFDNTISGFYSDNNQIDKYKKQQSILHNFEALYDKRYIESMHDNKTWVISTLINNINSYTPCSTFF